MEAGSLYFNLNLNPPKSLPKLHSPTNLNFPFAAESRKSCFCKTHLNLKIMVERKGAQEAFTCRSRAESGDFVGSFVIRADSGDGSRRKKLAVFVSGGGSNFRAIHEATGRGQIHGDVAVLVTDKPGCGGAEYARDKDIPILLFPKTLNGLVTSLREFEIDFLLLAGFLKLIPVELVRAFPKSILNIHPSLLPAFGGKGYYGLKVHKAVVASGARYSGPTVHFVDEHYDTGLILAQRVVPVLANDTAEELAARVLKQEHHLYVEAVAALCEGRIVWRDDGVPLIQNKENPNAYS